MTKVTPSWRCRHKRSNKHTSHAQTYKQIISNTYTRCNAEPIISLLSRRARWKLFGHILRLSEATPAQVSTTAYFQRQNQGWLGRPRITLPVVIGNELAKATSVRLRSLKDLETLRLVARNRHTFNDIIAQVTLWSADHLVLSTIITYFHIMGICYNPTAVIVVYSIITWISPTIYFHFCYPLPCRCT